MENNPNNGLAPSRAALVKALTKLASQRSALLNPITVALVEVGEPVRLVRIENTPPARSAAVGDFTEPLDIGLEGLIAVVGANAVLNGAAFNQYNPANGSFINGRFFIAGFENEQYVSLKPTDLEAIAWHFGEVQNATLLDQ